MSTINKSLVSEGSIQPIGSVVPHHHQQIDLIEQHSSSLKQSVLESYEHDQYSHINNEPPIKIFFYELIGTTVFVAVALSDYDIKFADASVAVGILLGVVFCGPVSGANLNPAVTLCNCFKKENKLKWKMFPLYLLAQFLATIIAIIYCELIDDFSSAALKPDSQDIFGYLQVVGSEVIGSFILIFFVLLISNPNTTFIDNELSGYVFIVVFIHAGRKYAPRSHECINSMIALCFALINGVQTADWIGLRDWLLWLAGDLLGTFIAIFFYEKLFQPNVWEMRRIKRELQDRNVQSILRMSQGLDYHQPQRSPFD